MGVGASRTIRFHKEPRWAPGPRYASCPPPPTYSQNRRREIKTRGGSFEFGLNSMRKKVSSASLAYDFSKGKYFGALVFAVFTGNIPSALKYYFIAKFE